MSYCSTPEVVVILAAGLGSRLRAHDVVPKPLVSVAGQPLLKRVISQFEVAGIRKVVVVLGHRADEVRATLASEPFPSALSFVINPKYTLSNGLSVLAAREAVGNRAFFLSMADHIFDQSLIKGLMTARVPTNGLVLAVDHKLDTIFDMEDATKVRTRDGRIEAIGKSLDRFDAVDTGLFSCSPTIFDAIHARSVRHPDGDCSLSQGVEALTAAQTALVHDIGDAIWQDVDTPSSLVHAETLFG